MTKQEITDFYQKKIHENEITISKCNLSLHSAINVEPYFQMISEARINIRIYMDFIKMLEKLSAEKKASNYDL